MKSCANVSWGVLFLLALVGGSSPEVYGKQTGDTPQLYVFSMPQCGPCQRMEPDIQRLVQSGYPVTKIDCLANQAWANHFQISSTPTIVMTIGQRVVGRSVGPMNFAEMVGMFDSVGFRPGGGRNSVAVAPSTQANSAAPTPTPSQATSDIAPATAPQQAAYQATVRIRVIDPQGTSYGTGTVIHRHENEYLVVTCGHIFRESQGRGQIMVDYGFFTGSKRTAPAELLDYDSEDRDIGLIVFRGDLELQPVPVAPRILPIQPNDAAFTLGCNHGEDPTLRQTRVIRSALYDGAKKYDTVGRPVDGRSGGGLFSAGGQLIGICNAAAVEVDEGVYSSLDNIYAQFERTRLTHLFERGTTSVAVNTPQAMPEVPATLEDPRTRSEWATASSQINQTVPVNGRDDVEIIMVVRSKSNPNSAETLLISNPSPEFVQQVDRLRQQNTLAMRPDDRGSFPTPRAAAAAPLVRGQSQR